MNRSSQRPSVKVKFCMKKKADIIQGWVRKAESDLRALKGSIEADSLDAACFHAQQAAEKFLKAFLSHVGEKFPFTHNLSKLVHLCIKNDPSFSELLTTVESLTPFAVELRYDDEFWPSLTVAEEALQSALKVKNLVLKKLPPS